MKLLYIVVLFALVSTLALPYSAEAINWRWVMVSNSSIYTPNLGNGIDNELNADIDGDGDLDPIVTANPTYGNTLTTADVNATVWYETPSDIYTTNFTMHVIDQDCDYAHGFTAANFSGDAYPDLAYSCYDNGKIRYAVNPGTSAANIRSAPNWTIYDVDVSATHAHDVIVFDCDQDGDLDIFGGLILPDGKAVMFYENDGTPAGSGWAEKKVLTAEAFAMSDACDVDGDGDQDFFVATYLEKKVYLMVNNGTCGFSSSVEWTAANAVRDVECADFDGDGDNDSIASDMNADIIVYLENNDSAGNFTVHTVCSGAAACDGPMKLDAGDVDNDGDIDFVASLNLNHTVVWFNNTDGMANFSRVDIASVGSHNYIRGINLGDFDNDGMLEVLASTDSEVTEDNATIIFDQFPPVVMASPANTSYTSATPLTFHYYYDGASCNWSAYSINGGTNITTGCLNVTEMNASPGGNEFIFWINASDGSAWTFSINFTYYTATYTVNVYDEMTGDEFNTSEMLLSAFCTNDTQTWDLTNWTTPSIYVTCDLVYMKLEMNDSSGNNHYRTLIPTASSGTLDWYMINNSDSTTRKQNYIIYDVTGDYLSGYVVVTKVIEGIGTTTVIEQYIDAENKVTLHLIDDERYTIIVYSSSGTNARIIGNIIADADATKRLVISTVPYVPSQDLTFKDVIIYVTWDEAGKYIKGIYNDTLAETTSVVFTVYNATNVSQVVYTASSSANVVTFTYNNVEWNNTYIVDITAQHTGFGEITERRTASIENRYRIAGLATLGYGIYMSMAAGLISMFVMLAFSRKFAKVGLAVGVIFMVFFMYWGWFDDSPQLGWGFLTLVAFIALANVLTRKGGE